MSRKFVRNVTGTKLTGEKIEPFDTNVQNDLLSDETDVYVRQERSKKIDDKYHCLTDDVKEVISNSDLISTENFEHGKSEQDDKNKSYINVNKSNKTESEKMESNSHVMTPLQTGYSIEKNNRDVIPNLVKQHETPTEIVSKSNELKVKKVSKNNFELSTSLSNYIDSHKRTIFGVIADDDDLTITLKNEYNYRGGILKRVLDEHLTTDSEGKKSLELTIVTPKEVTFIRTRIILDLRNVTNLNGFNVNLISIINGKEVEIVELNKKPIDLSSRYLVIEFTNHIDGIYSFADYAYNKKATLP